MRLDQSASDAATLTLARPLKKMHACFDALVRFWRGRRATSRSRDDAASTATVVRPRGELLVHATRLHLGPKPLPTPLLPQQQVFPAAYTCDSCVCGTIGAAQRRNSGSH